MVIDRCTIHPTATVTRDGYLHRAKIGAHTIVEPYASVVWCEVGDYCYVGQRAVVEDLPDVLGKRVPDGSVLEAAATTDAEITAQANAGVVFGCTVMWTPDQGTWVKPGCLPWEPIATTIDRIRAAGNEGFCTRIGHFKVNDPLHESFMRRVKFWADKLAEWDLHTTSWAKDAA